MADSVVETPIKLDQTDGCVSSKVDKKEEEAAVTPVEQCKTNGTQVKANDESNTIRAAENNNKTEEKESNENESELYFTPKVSLPLVDTKTLEDDEDVIVELRARIYRYDDSEEEAEFKERGTGVVKILCHKKTNLCRVLMRRDKTLKICANHYITSNMQLVKHSKSQKAFVYSTLADLYESETNPETFAIQFSNAENATIFKNAFDDAVKEMKAEEKKKAKENDIAATLEKVQLDDKEPKDDQNEDK